MRASVYPTQHNQSTCDKIAGLTKSGQFLRRFSIRGLSMKEKEGNFYTFSNYMHVFDVAAVLSFSFLSNWNT